MERTRSPSAPLSFRLLVTLLLSLVLITVALFSLFAVAIRSAVGLFLVSVLRFVLLGLLLLLLLPVLYLVLYQIVECGDGPDETAEIYCHELVVGLDAHRPRQFAVLCLRFVGAVDLWCGLWRGQIWEKVEDVLKVTEDRVVNG